MHGCNCMETDNHLFFHCQVAKALLFALPWNIKWEFTEDLSLEEKLNLLTNPGRALSIQPDDKEDFFIHSTLILDLLWNLRNKTLFESTSFSLKDIVDWLNHRFREAKAVMAQLNQEITLMPTHKVCSWKTSNTCCLTINTDAAVKNDQSLISLVARDNLSFILKVKAVQFP